MYQGDRADITMPITGGEDGAVAANRLIIMDAANVSNGKVSTANAQAFVGVTLELTDKKGYAPVRINGVARVKAGVGGVVAGNQVASDATGQGVAITPSTPGTVKQVVGVAMTSAAAGELLDLLIRPTLAFT